LFGLYEFPDADELVVEEEREEAQDALEVEEPLPQEPAAEESEEEKEPEESENPVRFAQIQGESILKKAAEDARQILEEARQEAEVIRDNARQEGLAQGQIDGFQIGLEQALEQSRQTTEQRCAELEEEVEQFINRANSVLEQQLEDNVDELRDLSIAIAEKVVCVSLKSSSEVISRMIQTALDKRKKQEWVRIYIAESDTRHLAKVNASLTAALSSLSDRIRVIPMSDDEPGTCIVELPDEIIDASASTQLNNIRNLLGTTPARNDQDAPFRWRNKTHVQADDPSGE
jgi:flagellar assembly protein FliH